MQQDEREQTGVNDSRTPDTFDTGSAHGRSGPVRYELIDKDGRVVASADKVTQLAEAAELYLPNQAQDEDRTGAGWDIQIQGAQ